VIDNDNNGSWTQDFPSHSRRRNSFSPDLSPECGKLEEFLITFCQMCQLELRRLGIETEVFMRPIDRLAWPHATKGFYASSKCIPDMRDNLVITPQRQMDLLTG
jgi:hypothetical protein